MVLVFFVVNLLRIDLYDVVKEIKKGRDTMKTIIKRSILDYLKNPVLWIGLIIKGNYNNQANPQNRVL